MSSIRKERLYPGSLAARAVAWGIDLVVVLLVYVGLVASSLYCCQHPEFAKVQPVLSLLASQLPGEVSAKIQAYWPLLLLFVLLWGYEYLGSRRQTLGRWLLRLKVLSYRYQPPGMIRSLWRTTLRTCFLASGLLVMKYGASYLPALVSRPVLTLAPTQEIVAQLPPFWQQQQHYLDFPVGYLVLLPLFLLNYLSAVVDPYARSLVDFISATHVIRKPKKDREFVPLVTTHSEEKAYLVSKALEKAGVSHRKKYLSDEPSVFVEENVGIAIEVPFDQVSQAQQVLQSSDYREKQLAELTLLPEQRERLLAEEEWEK